MHDCNYCGRILKHEYEKCPGCGGNSFKDRAYLGEEIIKTPPSGGYKINTNKYIIEIIINLIIVLVATMLLIITINNINEKTLILMVTFAILELAFLGGGLKLLISGIKETKRLKKLSQKGMLVKNMPYELVSIGFIKKKNEPKKEILRKIKVVFKNSDGVEIPLISDDKNNVEETAKNDDTADLLIDPNDYSNFYIDFEIY